MTKARWIVLIAAHRQTCGEESPGSTRKRQLLTATNRKVRESATETTQLMFLARSLKYLIDDI